MRRGTKPPFPLNTFSTLLLLVPAQRGAQDGAAIAAELFCHCAGIGGAQKRVYGRVAGLLTEMVRRVALGLGTQREHWTVCARNNLVNFEIGRASCRDRRE